MGTVPGHHRSVWTAVRPARAEGLPPSGSWAGVCLPMPPVCFLSVKLPEEGSRRPHTSVLNSITLCRGGDELFHVGKTSHTWWVLGQHAGKHSATNRRVLAMVPWWQLALPCCHSRALRAAVRFSAVPPVNANTSHSCETVAALSRVRQLAHLGINLKAL